MNFDAKERLLEGVWKFFTGRRKDGTGRRKEGGEAVVYARQSLTNRTREVELRLDFDWLRLRSANNSAVSSVTAIARAGGAICPI